MRAAVHRQAICFLPEWISRINVRYRYEEKKVFMRYFTFNCHIEANIWGPYCVCEKCLTFRDFYGIFAMSNY